MNLPKHMEAVFILSLGLALSATYLVEQAPKARAQAAAIDSHIATPGKMAIVTVSAKRLSRMEKLLSLQEERKFAAFEGGDGSRL